MLTPPSKCWAASRGDCRGPLTREHLVSNAILQPKITVQGLPWCKETPTTIGSASYTSKILCEKHNSGFSPCDTEIAKFVEAFRVFFDAPTPPPDTLIAPVTHRLSGPLIERWFLKTLINLACLHSTTIDVPVESLLAHLFDDRRFEHPFGLSFVVGNGEQVNWGAEDSIVSLPILDARVSPSALVGGRFIFRSLKLIVLLPGRQVVEDGKLALANAAGWEGLQLNWHNERIGRNQQSDGSYDQAIELSWA